jgi:diguanylate cyclase (GGDEF)-like protein
MTSHDEFAVSLMDPFTGLYNRRGLRLRLAEKYERATQLRVPLSLLAIDLDLFAEINNKFFIPAGDKVIAEIACALTRSAGSEDVIARDGGDQFSLILRGIDGQYAYIDGQYAYDEAERMRLVIATTLVEYRNEQIAVTASLGVASATFSEAEPWELFMRARNAVRGAKEAGRNTVVVG